MTQIEKKIIHQSQQVLKKHSVLRCWKFIKGSPHICKTMKLTKNILKDDNFVSQQTFLNYEINLTS